MSSAVRWFILLLVFPAACQAAAPPVPTATVATAAAPEVAAPAQTTRPAVPAASALPLPSVAPELSLTTVLLPWQDGSLPVYAVPAPRAAPAELAAQFGSSALTVSDLRIGTAEAPLLTISAGRLTTAVLERQLGCPYALVAFDPGSSALISVVPLDRQLMRCGEVLQFNPAANGGLQRYMVPPAPTAPLPADLPDPSASAAALAAALAQLQSAVDSGPLLLLSTAALPDSVQVLALTPEGPLHLFVLREPSATWRVGYVTPPPIDLDRLQAAGFAPGLAFPPPAIETVAVELLLAARAWSDEQTVLLRFAALPTADRAELLIGVDADAAALTAERRDGAWQLRQP